MTSKWFIRLLLASSLSFGSSYVNAQTVKITPLGSHAGELCQNDRALIFEDPSGVRVLYDAGAAIAGGTDPAFSRCARDIAKPCPRRSHRRYEGGYSRCG